MVSGRVSLEPDHSACAHGLIARLHQRHVPRYLPPRSWPADRSLAERSVPELALPCLPARPGRCPATCGYGVPMQSMVSIQSPPSSKAMLAREPDTVTHGRSVVRAGAPGEWLITPDQPVGVAEHGEYAVFRCQAGLRRRHLGGVDLGGVARPGGPGGWPCEFHRLSARLRRSCWRCCATPSAEMGSPLAVATSRSVAQLPAFYGICLAASTGGMKR